VEGIPIAEETLFAELIKENGLMATTYFAGKF
jgi:hypothetical protein